LTSVEAVPPEQSCTDDVCITCSDEGRVAEVRAVYGDGRADVLVGGRPAVVDVSLVDARPGDLLLVHAGVALTLIDGPPGTKTEQP
jgi:hydrogenase maturation factor